MFSTNPCIKFNFRAIFILSSANVFNLIWPNMILSGIELWACTCAGHVSKSISDKHKKADSVDQRSECMFCAVWSSSTLVAKVTIVVKGVNQAKKTKFSLTFVQLFVFHSAHGRTAHSWLLVFHSAHGRTSHSWLLVFQSAHGRTSHSWLVAGLARRSHWLADTGMDTFSDNRRWQSTLHVCIPDPQVELHTDQGPTSNWK